MTDKKKGTPISSSSSISDEKKHLDFIYELANTSEEDLLQLYEIFKYKGFDRKIYIKKLCELPECNNKKTLLEIIIICAINGPQKAVSTIIPSQNKTIGQLGIPASGAKGSDRLTCARITASTADLAAFFLKKFKIPKKLNVPCPGWLQFPAAGSIDMPDNFRIMHREFAEKFSGRLISKSTGKSVDFNEQIYETMMSNSYYDPKLKLFED